MAIGKVNAYATVEPSKVDFGDIALNAQKIQSSKFETLKDMIPKQKPAKEYKDEKLAFAQYSDNNNFNVSFADSTLQKVTPRYKELSMAAQDGVITPEELSEKNQLENWVKNVSDGMKSFTDSHKKYVENISKKSKAFDSKSNYLESFYKNNGQNSLVNANDITGDPFFQTYETEDDNVTVKVDPSTGEKILKTYVDENGNIQDRVRYSDLVSGQFFNIPEKVDIQKGVSDIAKYVDPYKFQKDNGIVSNLQEYLTPNNISAIDNGIKVFIGEKGSHTFKDIAYQMYPDEFKNPQKQYTDEQYDKVFKKLKTTVLGGIGTSNITNITLPPKEPVDKNKIDTNIITVKDVILRDESINSKGKKSIFVGNPKDYYNNVIGLGKGLVTTTQGLGNAVAQSLILDKKGDVLVAGLRTKASNIRFTRDNGKTKNASEWDINDFSDSEKEKYDQLIMDSFSQKGSYENFVRKPTAGMQSAILKATGMSSWSQLTAKLKSLNQGKVR